MEWRAISPAYRQHYLRMSPCLLPATNMADNDDHKQTAPSSNSNQTIHDAVQAANAIWSTETKSAFASAEASQDTLQKQLDSLEKDMHIAANALAATGSIGEVTTRSIREAQECLLRAKRKLVTVRARVGRLRTFEEAQRLSVVHEPPLP